MKIAITAQGESLEDKVDPRFGRAQGFIVFDLDTESFEYISNLQNLNAMQGAGIQTAQNVAKTGAEAIITGHVGPKAFTALKAGKIKVYFCPEISIKEAIAKFKANELELADEADKPGHW